MGLCELTVRNFRIIESAVLTPSSVLNLISGENGSGKTSLLEAVHFLSQARSFRSRHFDDVLRRGQQSLRVTGKQTLREGGTSPLGIEKSTAQTRARLNGNPVARIADLAAALPVLVLHPESHELVAGGPGARRAFLDWGVFHSHAAFFDIWQRYQRALQQRNKALKSRMGERQVRAWDAPLVEAADAIDEARLAYMARLNTQMLRLAPALMGTRQLELRYQRGWSGEFAYAHLLDQGYDKDQQYGYTRLGPHRADIDIRVDSQAAHKTASRGQQKIVVALLKMAQAASFNEQHDQCCVFLIDDLPSELDVHHRQAFLEALSQLNTQNFITAISQNDLELTGWSERKMFHVEHGEIKELV